MAEFINMKKVAVVDQTLRVDVKTITNIQREP